MAGVYAIAIAPNAVVEVMLSTFLFPVKSNNEHVAVAPQNTFAAVGGIPSERPPSAADVPFAASSATVIFKPSDKVSPSMTLARMMYVDTQGSQRSQDADDGSDNHHFNPPEASLSTFEVAFSCAVQDAAPELHCDKCSGFNV